MTIAIFIVIIAIVFILIWINRPAVKIPTPSPQNNEYDHYRTAIHEAGHFITAWSCSHVTEIKSATIGYYGGKVEYTMLVDGTDDNNWCNLVITLAGISAETMVYGKVLSTNSKKDLLVALKLAQDILSNTPKYKPPTNASGKSINFMDVYTDGITHKEAELLAMAYRHAQSVICAHKEKYYHVVALLQDIKVLRESMATQILGTRVHIRMVGLFRPVFVYPGFKRAA